MISLIKYFIEKIFKKKQKTNSILFFPLCSGSSTGKYGFAEKVLDGMYIHVNSVSGTFISDTFHADIQVSWFVINTSNVNVTKETVCRKQIKMLICSLFQSIQQLISLIKLISNLIYHLYLTMQYKILVHYNSVSRHSDRCQMWSGITMLKYACN